MKSVITALADVAEGLRAEYEQKDGKFILKLEDVPPGFVALADLTEAKNKIAEFRDKNIDLLKQVKAKDDALASIDPNETTNLRKQIVDLEAKMKEKGATGNEQLLAAIAPLKAEIDNLRKDNERKDAERKASERALKVKGLENTLSVAAQKAGVDERAIDDFVQRGLRVFKLDDDGNITAKNGETPIYSKKDPGSLITVDEWAPTVKETAPHLFKASGGGGAAGGPGAGAAAASKNGNPNAKQLVNPTPQDLGRFAKQIAAGELVVVNQA